MKEDIFLEEIRSIPTFIEPALVDLSQQTAEVLEPLTAGDVHQVSLVGCGDSFHAGLCTEFYFQKVAGLRCRALSSMAFSRYETAVPHSDTAGILLIAVSSSGRVSRTVEAVILARKIGMRTLAITTNADSPLAAAAEHFLVVPTNNRRVDRPQVILPGSSTFVASLLALYISALRLGVITGALSLNSKKQEIDSLRQVGAQMAETINLSEQQIRDTARRWQAEDHYVFCGAGPNYGTALFSAAKVIEAAGASALGQDTEEWAHQQYFERKRGVPTIIISAGARDADRAMEIVVAARAVGRDVALVAPSDSMRFSDKWELKSFSVQGPIREEISPLLTIVPGLLLAAYLSHFLGEPYFRDFGSGRSIEEGGGISRIQSSHLIGEPPE